MDNTIFWIIGIILIGTLFYISQKPPEEVGLVAHYYKNGVEVFPTKGLFSIVTPPGGTYDQISFDISATNTGNVSITNMQIVDASPQAFKDVLPTTIQSLSVEETKLLWSSELINTTQFETYSQPVNFWINISGKNIYTTYLGKTIYSKGDLNIIFETEAGSDGTVFFTTSTKSYGNLIEDVDYKVNGDTFYLEVDRIYNFVNFTLGEGTDLRPWNPSSRGAVLYLQAMDTIEISGVVRSKFQYAYIPIRGQSVQTTFNDGTETILTPGVRNGGSGGIGGDAYDVTQGSGGSQRYGFGGGGAGGSTSMDGNTEGRGGNGGSGGTSPVGGIGCRADGSGDNECNGGHGSNSGGGGGSAAATDGNSANGGDGGGTHGAWGQNGIDDWKEVGGGGGGAGGYAGYSGIHFYAKANIIYFNGSIYTSGTSGGSGGGGGKGQGHEGTLDCAGGGGGGGGGGAGNGGNIMFSANSITDTGYKSMGGGSGRSGGSGGAPNRDDKTYCKSGGSGSNGYSGYSGTFNPGGFCIACWINNIFR